MFIKKPKPTSPGIRHQILQKKNTVSKSNQLIKTKIKKFKNTGGRSSQTGHITCWHKGGGEKKRYRNIASKYKDYYFTVAIIYDPNRNSLVSLVFDPINCVFDLILTTANACVGSLLENGLNVEIARNGYTLPLEKIPSGTIINKISSENLTKTLYAKSAGTFGQIIQKNIHAVKIKLPSGAIITCKPKVIGTLGAISNKNYNLKVLGKAGKSRCLGKRSTVRGVAMNPVDHPHGGRTNGGRPSVTPWGKLTKGVPTKKKKKIYV
eukprot:gene676-1297_t